VKEKGTRFAKALAAVLLGNLVYFGGMNYLPTALQHEPFQMDLGLVLDAVVCLFFYGLIGKATRKAENRQ
jgi:hypothetical protein